MKIEKKQVSEFQENPSAMSVEIETFDRISLSDLKKIAAENTVFFTPHVGNKWREDLYTMSIPGVRTANFARNASVRDDLDKPEHLRVAGHTYPIAHSKAMDKATLTPHLHFGTNLHDHPKQIIEKLAAQRPAHLHHKATKLALPNAHLQTDSEAMILGPENQIIRDVIDQLHRALHRENGHAALQIFSRYVDKNGHVYYLDPNQNNQFQDKSGTTMPQIDRHEIGDLANFANDFFSFSQNIADLVNSGQLTGKLSGPMPRNELMVLLLGLKPLLNDLQSGKFQADQAEEYTAYSISGPSMIKYSTSKDFKKTLGFLYNQIKAILEGKFNLKMPAHLKIRMIPGSHLAYLPVKGETQAIDAISSLVKSSLDYLDTQKQLSSSVSKSKELLTEAAKRKKQQVAAVADVVAAVDRAQHISQYDLLEGRELIDTKVIQDLSFWTHGLIIDQIKKRHEKNN